MADYPDWTDLVRIVGTDIMVAIDLQASYVMMPVDIQAQYVDLTVDIVAQTVGHITVDIAAQSAGDITVDITAQTLSNINIQINAQAVRIYLVADWNVNEGNQKSLSMVGTNIDVGDHADGDYQVPTGKTLFITQLGFRISANAAASRNNNQMGEVLLYNVTTAAVYLYLGGNGGGGMPLTAPAKITAGQTVRLRITNCANHAIDYTGNWGGYEL